MILNVYLPLVLSAVLAMATPVLRTRLAPALSCRVLAATCAVTAACSSWGLILLSATLLQHTPTVERAGPAPRPVPLFVAWLALAALAGGTIRAGVALRRRRTVQTAMQALCRHHNADGELVVVTGADPRAYAIPGSPGHLVVSTGLLAVATATERRIVFAHERAHLQQRHHLLRIVTELAAAVNPLLIPARTAVTFLVERAADESAARAVGSRREVAAALCRLGLLVGRVTASPLQAFQTVSVPRRVEALQAPMAPSWPALIAPCGVLAAAAAASAGDATLALTRLVVRIVGP